MARYAEGTMFEVTHNRGSGHFARVDSVNEHNACATCECGWKLIVPQASNYPIWFPEEIQLKRAQRAYLTAEDKQAAYDTLMRASESHSKWARSLLCAEVR